MLGKKISLFRFPRRDERLRRLWLEAVRSPDSTFSPSSARVCSEHFVDGKPSKAFPVPSINVPGILQTHKDPVDLVRQPEQAADLQVGGNQECEELCQMKCQVTMMESEIDRMKHLVKDLEKTVSSQKNQLEKLLFSYKEVKRNSARLSFYTGFPDTAAFDAFFNFIKPMAVRMDYKGTGKVKEGHKTGPSRKLSLIDEFLMTCIRLKVGLLEVDLAERFQVSVTTVSRTVVTWVCLLHSVLTQDISFGMERHEVDALMPPAFINLGYSDVRIILDATEIRIERPSHPQIQRSTWSEYKHGNTLKGLVGISPNGCVTFVSKLYGGSISDTQLTLQSGLLHKLTAGDAIMADRGFDMRHETSKEGIRLYIPPFTRGRKALSYVDAEDTRTIACLRIDVERAIRRMKSFHILNGSPLSLTLVPLADQIFSVCAFLTNFQTPLRTHNARHLHTPKDTVDVVKKPSCSLISTIRPSHATPSPVSALPGVSATDPSPQILATQQSESFAVPSVSPTVQPASTVDPFQLPVLISTCSSQTVTEPSPASCSPPSSVHLSVTSDSASMPNFLAASVSSSSSNTEPLLTVLNNIPSSFPWNQLQFRLHSGMYFNSCAYDTSFHCIGAVYNLIDLTKKFHVIATPSSTGFQQLANQIATHRGPHSIKMALWSWLASCSRSGSGAQPPLFRKPNDTSVVDVLWQFFSIASQDQPYEQDQSNLITVEVDEIYQCTSCKNQQIMSNKKRHRLVIMPTSVKAVGGSAHTHLSKLVTQTVLGRTRKENKFCQLYGTIMQGDLVCSYFPPVLCIGLTTALGSMITKADTLQKFYAFKIDMSVSLPGKTERVEYILAAAIFNIAHHYSACCLQIASSGLSYHYYNSSNSALSPISLTGDPSLPQEASRTASNLEAIMYLRSDLHTMSMIIVPCSPCQIHIY